MLFNDIIRLITITDTVNALGDTIKGKGYRETYADTQSIRQSEFYQAAAAGLRPQIMFVIRACDYEGEPMLEYHDTEYSIIRTYKKDTEFIELVCQGLVNGVM